MICYSMTLALILFILTTALFDGVSTAQQAIFQVMLLSSSRPIGNSVGYLSGISVAYFLCGLAGLAMAAKLNALLHLMNASSSTMPDATYYQIEFWGSLLFVLAGPWTYRRSHKSTKPGMEQRFWGLMQRVNPLGAFAFGAFISGSSFPASFPYIGAIEKIALSGIHREAAWALLGIYNIIYILPTMVPFIIYLVLRWTIEGLEHQLHVHVERINLFITVLMLSGMGLVGVVDASYFWLTGHALFGSRFF